MPGRKVVAVPGVAKYRGKLLAVNRAKHSVTVVDPKTRRRLPSVPLPKGINFKVGYLYYIKAGSLYEVKRAKRGMRASTVDDDSSSDYTDEDY